MHYLFVLTIMMTAAFAPVKSAAQDQDQDSPFQLADGEFYERLENRGRVSGDIIMGMMIGTMLPDTEGLIPSADAAPRPTANLEVLALPTPPEAENTQPYCVRINSKDGRFESENTYEVSGNVSVPDGAIIYDGDYGPEISEMQVVSLIKVGRCGDRTDVVIPSVWSDSLPPISDRALHVFVNAAGNPTAVRIGENDEYLSCMNVAEASTLKYTASCVLPFQDILPAQVDGQIPLTFYVTRSLGEEEFSVTVAMPQRGN